MIRNITKHRTWQLKLSLRNRICYLTNKPLKFKLAYRGRKYISDILNRHKPAIDDIWLCKEKFLEMYSRNEIT